MTDQVRRELVDYLLGSLDESEMDGVRARLQSDPSYRYAMRLANGDLCRLRALKRDVPPPPRLAERTCKKVLDPVERLRLAKLRARGMTPSPPPPPPGRLNWTDVTVAGAIFLIAGLLILPAIYSSRFQARVTSCQDNLRDVGQALTEYSRRNHDLFPEVPERGNFAAGGIWAPTLQDEGFLVEPQRVLCPDSPQAEERDFHIPSLRRASPGGGT